MSRPEHHLLEVRNLTINRGDTPVLRVPELYLQEKEVLALIGPNGAGKSTLLLALASLLPPNAGEIRCRGELINSDTAKLAFRRRLAMVFQEPLLFDATVYDNVASGLKIRGMAVADVKKRVMETLDTFNMVHLADRSARKISGGEAQRTSLARAFAMRPELILLDEPFTSLDPPTRLALTEDLERILHETKTAAVLTTHDQLEALRLADRITVMSDGCIVQSGPPIEVMNHPANEFVASFVGMDNIMSGTITGSSEGLLSVSVNGHHIVLSGSSAQGGGAVLCVRPENITITTTDPGGSTSARNVVPAVIDRIVNLGSYCRISLDCGFPLVACLTQQSISDMNLTVGKRLFASFKATAVHLIRSGE